MNKTDKSTLREKLDRLGEEWAASDLGDEGVQLKLQGEIFETVYQLFPKQSDEINTLYLKEEWKRFDHTKSSLSRFFAARIGYRGKELYYWERGQRQVTEIDPVTGEKRRVRRDRIVQEPIIGDEEGPALTEADQQQIQRWRESGSDDTLAAVLADESCYQALILILNLSERLQGRANNPVKQTYYRMFFTDGVASCLQHGEAPTVLVKWERDLFDAMKLPFLDYFMADCCRTAMEIQASSLKAYGQLVEGRPMDKSPSQPLPGDVYTTYLKRVEGHNANQSAVSQQWTAYRDFLRENLF